MADAIAKFLARLSKAEHALVLDSMLRIRAGNIQGLHAKKLVGSKDLYRVRKGVFRIIYRQSKTDCTIIVIDRRSEKTYRDF